MNSKVSWDLWDLGNVKISHISETVLRVIALVGTGNEPRQGRKAIDYPQATSIEDKRVWEDKYDAVNRQHNGTGNDPRHGRKAIDYPQATSNEDKRVWESPEERIYKRNEELLLERALEDKVNHQRYPNTWKVPNPLHKLQNNRRRRNRRWMKDRKRQLKAKEELFHWVQQYIDEGEKKTHKKNKKMDEGEKKRPQG